ncbi:MAG: hypothetical protein JHD16_16380 [Solirubrobacteraceae bacterium]|nr:hypothetical protein [Solirubrobacteraceae bacterium]
MSYFDHLSDRSVNPIDAVDGRGRSYLAVVGESFYRRNIAALADGHLGTTHTQALLVREPANHYDPNCIAVCSPQSKLLGHLSRANARRFSHALDRLGRPVLVDAEIRRDTLDHDYNVVLRVDYGVLSGRR